MKTNTTKRLGSLLLLIAMLASCSSNSTETDEMRSSSSGESEPVETTLAYTGNIADWDGYTFTILNCADDFWAGSNHILDYDGSSGEAFETAIFERNLAMEEQLNIDLVVEKGAEDALRNMMNEAVLAGLDIYDAAYIFLNMGGATSFDGEYTLNLYDVDTLQLDKEWWPQAFIESATTGQNQLYTSIDNINMMGFSYSNGMFFNKDMVTEHGLEMPYDLVRNGKWTYDAMFQYMETVVNLNGQPDWSPSLSNPTVYGLGCQHAEATMVLLQSAGEYLITKNDSNIPELNTNTDRMIQAFDTLVNVMSRDGYCVMINSAEGQGLDFFVQDKAMFYIGSLGIGNSERMRNTEMEYGIIPTPKMDETQNTYHSMISQYTLALNIPKTASDPNRTGEILDYMAFLGYRDVIPTLMNNMCYKGLRDTDSIEMLNICLNTQTLDIGVIYGWTTNFLMDIGNDIVNGNQKFASKLASQVDSITTELAKVYS